MKTTGFHHIQIAVTDMGRSFAFYTQLLGMEKAFGDGNLVFLRTPGCSDLLTLHPVDGPLDPSKDGMQHFGFSVAPEDHAAAVEEARAFGAEVLAVGRHGGPNGTPYAYIKDPDGYIIEL